MIALGLYFLLLQIGLPYLSQLQKYKPTNIHQNLCTILVDPVLNYAVIAICAGELENYNDLVCEIESLEMHVTDIEVEMQLKEQEVAVLRQVMEQLTQERQRIGS